MPAFSEYFVRNAVPHPTLSSLSSSSLKSDFRQYCNFNSNVTYVHYWYNPLRGIQQYPALFADYFAGACIPMRNIWPYCYYHYSISPKRSFNQQPAAIQLWPADAAFFTVNQIPGTFAYVTQLGLDKQHDTSPFSSDISRSSSTASSDNADSASSGIGSQYNYHQQEESGDFPVHVAVASSSDTNCFSPSQITNSNFEILDHSIAGASSLANFCDYKSVAAGFYLQKQQSESKLTGLQSQTSLSVLVTAYSTHSSAMKFYNLRKRYLARKGNGSSAGNLRFGIGCEIGFENINPAATYFHVHPAATCFHAYQSPNHLPVPLEAIETYIQCLERYVIHGS